MPFVDTNELNVTEHLPGWKGRYFHSANMTLVHYEFAANSSIHEHFHSQEEVYEVIEGELEVTIDGKSQVAKPGVVAIVPANSRRSVRAWPPPCRGSPSAPGLRVGVEMIRGLFSDPEVNPAS